MAPLSAAGVSLVVFALVPHGVLCVSVRGRLSKDNPIEHAEGGCRSAFMCCLSVESEGRTVPFCLKKVQLKPWKLQNFQWSQAWTCTGAGKVWGIELVDGAPGECNKSTPEAVMTSEWEQKRLAPKTGWPAKRALHESIHRGGCPDVHNARCCVNDATREERCVNSRDLPGSLWKQCRDVPSTNGTWRVFFNQVVKGNQQCVHASTWSKVKKWRVKKQSCPDTHRCCMRMGFRTTEVCVANEHIKGKGGRPTCKKYGWFWDSWEKVDPTKVCSHAPVLDWNGKDWVAQDPEEDKQVQAMLKKERSLFVWGIAKWLLVYLIAQGIKFGALYGVFGVL